MSSIAITLTQERTGFFLSILEIIMAKVEQFRVRNHLRIVERELRNKNTSHLSPELQRRREENIARLHEYWTTGVFPKNPDFFDRRIPYFKDHLGTPCAMAYLIEESGHRDLVNAVASTNNHVYINDIHDGPVLDWINQSGLTKAEAARVQPAYGPCGFAGCPIDPLTIMLPWIIGSISFILLEWLSYYIASWLGMGNTRRRLVAWAYFTLNNLLLAAIIAILAVGLIDKYSRYGWY